MNIKNIPKSIWVLLGIFIIIIVGVYIFAKTEPAPSDTNTQTQPEASAPIETTEVSAGSSAPSGIKPTAKSMTYEQALSQYRDHRLQFDNCAAQPTWMTFKTGTQIMLDNRSPDPSEIHLDRSVFRLGGNEFRIVTLSGPRLPKTVSVDCFILDQPAYNVAEIYVQP